MIKLDYSSNGKIANIHILIDNIYYPLPNPIDKIINWDTIEYLPTRKSLQLAWEAWASDKDLTIELADRPDLATAIITPPQWESFIKDMFINAAYNEIINDSITSTRIITRLETACTVYLANPSSSPEFIIQFFNELINSLASNNNPSIETITEWNRIAMKNSMDIIFNDSGIIQKI